MIFDIVHFGTHSKQGDILLPQAFCCSFHYRASRSYPYRIGRSQVASRTSHLAFVVHNLCLHPVSVYTMSALSLLLRRRVNRTQHTCIGECSASKCKPVECNLLMAVAAAIMPYMTWCVLTNSHRLQLPPPGGREVLFTAGVNTRQPSGR